jgi:hypothetical protein
MGMFNGMEESIILHPVMQQKENFKTIQKASYGGDLYIAGKMDSKGNLADFCDNYLNKKNM